MKTPKTTITSVATCGTSLCIAHFSDGTTMHVKPPIGISHQINEAWANYCNAVLPPYKNTLRENWARLVAVRDYYLTQTPCPA